jgi:hypothetical protein
VFIPSILDGAKVTADALVSGTPPGASSDSSCKPDIYPTITNEKNAAITNNKIFLAFT